MKSFCARGLILLAAVGWLAGPASAQSGGAAPSLLPLPRVAPADATTASYNAHLSTLDSYGSAFIPPKPEPTPANGAPSKETTGRTAFDESLHDTGWTEDTVGCLDGCCEDTCCRGGFFGGIGGLVMGRNRANPYWTTYETNNNANQLMNTQDAGANWTGGGQVTVGYGFGGTACGSCGGCGGCGSYLGSGIAFTYWGLGPMTATSSVRDINNNLSTPIDLNTQTGSVLIGTRPASDFFDNSREHRITRDDRVNNFEINVLQGGWTVGRLQMAALAGFRYFRFDERLSFGAAAGGTEFGENGGADSAFLNFRTTNNLYGAQVGALFNYNLTQRLGVFMVPKAGVYANQMTCRTLLFTGDGQFGYDIAGHKNDFAFLGEIDTGFSYALTPSLRAFIGYRVVGVANVALADNQFLPFLADTQGFSEIKQNGNLILHGAFMGVGWFF